MSSELDPDLEKLLREFLTEDKRVSWKEDMRTRMERLFDKATQTQADMNHGFAEVNKELVLIKRDQAAMTARLDKLEEAEEVTGIQDRAKLIEKLKGERTKVERWQTWFLGIVAALMLALITAGAALAIRALRQPSSATPTGLSWVLQELSP